MDPPRVEVEWVDSANLFGDRWADERALDDHADEHVCRTVGFLVRECDHSLFVAGSLAPSEVGSVMQIPRVAVKAVHRLRRC